MTVVAVETFFAILALVAMASVVGAAALRLAAVVSTSARRRWDGLARAVGPNAYAMAWFVAFLATAGSLYFSEVAGFEPCRLCWYQRIAMYPLVIVLAIAAARRERAGTYYAAAIALIGALVSVYHVTLEWFPSLDSGACSATTPCTLIWFRMFGFISLPTLALSAFALILTLMVLRHASDAPDQDLESALAIDIEGDTDPSPDRRPA
jgi:disulfide bond formation protein DsbB